MALDLATAFAVYLLVAALLGLTAFTMWGD